MGRRRNPAIARVVCPNALHQGSRVVAKGKRHLKTGTRQVYECQARGHKKHKFSVVISSNNPEREQQEVVIAAPPPKCREHEVSKVIRAGLYPSKARAEKSGVARRQRYRCFPIDGKPHDFTPPLPRLAVEVGHEHCDLCQGEIGVHRGAQASARKHPTVLHVVVDTLEKVAGGDSYTHASTEAREQLGSYTPRSTRVVPDDDQRVSVAAKSARSHWHISADWVEIYAPVCWEYVVGEMRATELEQARQPDPLRPQVLLIDALPAVSKRGKSSKRQRWHILGAAQTQWTDGAEPSPSGTLLRQLRAVPVENHLAWRLFLDELSPYEPDYVVADLGKAQMKAVRETWPNATIIPSLYHLFKNLNTDLERTKGATYKDANDNKRFQPDILDHLRTLNGNALVGMSFADWKAWWVELSSILSGLGCNPRLVDERFQRISPDLVLLLPHLNRLKKLPLSTGGLEVLLADRVKPLFQRRQHSFANIERTNNLLDLVVCRDRGLFLDRGQVAELIRADNEQAEGWSLPPRQIADRMTRDPKTQQLCPTPSLVDQSLIQALAIKRGYL